jgi:CubicO group peptidase (beta-lactamase class C family)
MVSLRELLSVNPDFQLLPTVAFLPGPLDGSARESFAGRLQVNSTRMQVLSGIVKTEAGLLSDPHILPAFELNFTTEGDLLVPEILSPIRCFRNVVGGIWWDVLIQLGRIWSVDGEENWSRGAFPFGLVNPLENETYHGLALFAFKGDRTSSLRFQIVQQTAPFLIREHIVATGSAETHFVSTTVEPRHVAIRTTPRLGTWPQLIEEVGAAALKDFDSAVWTPGLIASGLDLGGRTYLRDFTTLSGSWPYPAETRIGVWSVTKSALATVGLLRLAEIYGETILNELITRHVPELAGIAAWKSVTFGHTIGMATGVGGGPNLHAPGGIIGGHIAPDYARWYFALSAAEKIEAIRSDSHPESWGPGEVFRYRDQDIFVLGVAMDRFLRANTGAGLSNMLTQEVFTPIGISETSFSTTIEPDGAEGLPLLAFGFRPTIDELMRIARLLHAKGRHDGRQILNASLLHSILHGGSEVGLPTGRSVVAGEVRYFMAFWRSPVQMPDGDRLQPAKMLGYGGNVVLLLPNGVTIFRFAKDLPEEGRDFDTTALVRIGMRLASGDCGERNLTSHDD